MLQLVAFHQTDHVCLFCLTENSGHIWTDVVLPTQEHVAPHPGGNLMNATRHVERCAHIGLSFIVRRKGDVHCRLFIHRGIAERIGMLTP